jgi:WD40 repeat protein
MDNRSTFNRIGLVSLFLLAAALACNLARQSGSPTSQPVPTVERPSVEILEPAENATFTKGQTISVKARATGASGVTLVQLLVNGIPVASQPPAEAINPTSVDVVLDYTPDQAGIITLAVRAYSNSVVGQPAQRTVQVVDQLNPGQGGTGSQTQAPLPTATVYNPQCRARVNTGLNFRTGPGTNYDKILTLSAGVEPPITGYADRTDGRWWQVIWGGQPGWIASAYTTQLGDCSLIRPATVPASPTPVPSQTPVPTQPGTTATPTLPDLVFSLFEGVTDLTLGADGTMQATYVIEVKNQGGQASGQFRMAVAKPNGELEYFDVPGLNAGQSYRVPSNGLTITFDTPGIVRMVGTVDVDNTVAEGNENNNQTYIDITVNPNPNAGETGGNDQSNQPPTDDSLVNNGNGSGEPSGGGSEVSLVPSGPITAGNAAALTEIAALQGHAGMVSALAFGPQGTLLASASWDGTVRLWDVGFRSERATLIGHADRVTSVAVSPDGSRVASGSWDHTVRLWDAASGAEVTSFDHGAEVNAVAFSPDGAWVASGGLNPDSGGGLQGLAVVWNASSGEQVAAIQTFGPVSGVALLSGSSLAVATEGQGCDGGGAVEIYGLPGGDQIGTLTPDGAWVDALAVSADRSLIAASGEDVACSGAISIWVWDAGGGLRLALDHGAADADGIAFGPGGSLIAATSSNGGVGVWDTGSGTALVGLNAHANGAQGIAFSPDGLLIASGGGDGVVRLWGVTG